MDYTTLALCKNGPLRIKVTADDTFLTQLITEVSRDVDRYCTGVSDGTSDNYFALATVTDELLTGNIDYQGRLLFYPHKPIVNSITALAYRPTPQDVWTTLDPTLCWINGLEVTVWIQVISVSRAAVTRLPQRVQVKVSYTGGFGATTTALPQDLVQAVTQLVVRSYHEYEAGLNDAVGSEETGVFMYNKQIPVTVKRKLENFKRPVGWRHIG